VKKSCTEAVPEPRARSIPPRIRGAAGGSRRGPLRVAVIWAALGATVLCLLSAHGESQSEAIRNRQRELESLRKEIGSNRSKIEELRKKEADLSKLSGTLEKDRALTRKYLGQLEIQEAALRHDLAERQAELTAKETEAEHAANRLKKRLLRYSKLRRVTGAELLFSSTSFNQLFARSQFLARLIHQDRLDLGALSQEREEIARSTAILNSRRRGIAALQDEQRREAARLQQEDRKTQRELAGVQDERERHEQRLQELEASQTAIRDIIAKLERDRAREPGPGGTREFGGTLEGLRGRLLWPVEGRVLAEFGYEIHPKYKTRVPMNGIVIAAPEGTPIRAVAPGRVEFVDWYPGYGRTIILNHGSGYYSLYAHASEVLVARGAEVRAGQEIARVGDTDSIRGPCLHFEVRRGVDALDPRDWLQPRAGRPPAGSASKR
jgi:septal ring factor EnvC (AmiA/AmiB activator)